ncbi:MAG TPA: extracellular solute-binding protein [Candidatus Acidoferrum sp.]|nr:extracellular solute-binding protein [Candidatus Acidoferrum sp.]
MANQTGKRGVTRRQVLVGLGATAAGVLAGTRPAAPAVARAKTRLVYANYEQKQTGVIAGLSNYWDLAKDAFERKYPDIEIVQVSVPSSEYWNKLFTEITTGNAADLYKDRLSEVVQFARMGLLSPLDELCNVKDINASFEDIQKIQIVDANTYGAAYQGGSHQLVYNKTLLSKAGLKVPGTPEEAYEFAKKLTKPGEQWGFVVVTPSVPQLYVDLTQWVVGYNSHWGDKGRVTATADATVAAMEMYRRLVAEGITPVGVPKPQPREMFVAGKIGMMIEGPWFFADPKITPERMAFMGTATLPWANKRSVGSASAFIVPKAAKNKEAAGKFIDFCCSQEWQIKFLEVAKLPGNRKGAFPKSFIDKFPFMAAYAEGGSKAVDSCPSGLEDVFKQLQKYVIDAAGEFLFKNVPVKKALETVQAQMEKELEAGNKKKS